MEVEELRTLIIIYITTPPPPPSPIDNHRINEFVSIPVKDSTTTYTPRSSE